MPTKLSQITSSPSSPAATDTLIGVHGGTTDYQYPLSQVWTIVPGSVGAPTLVSNADATTGLWFPASGQFAFSSGGSNVFDYGYSTSNSLNFTAIAAPGMQFNSNLVIFNGISGNMTVEFNAVVNANFEISSGANTANINVAGASLGFTSPGYIIFTPGSGNNSDIYRFRDHNGNNVLDFAYTTGTTWTFGKDAAVNVAINNAALATNATTGFLYIPTCAGAPTGVPTSLTGTVPLVFDTTNSKFWIYTGGAWKQPETPGGAAIVTWQ